MATNNTPGKRNWMALALETEIRKRVPRLQFPNSTVKKQAMILGKAIEIANAAYRPLMGDYATFMARAVFIVMTHPDFKHEPTLEPEVLDNGPSDSKS